MKNQNTQAGDGYLIPQPLLQLIHDNPEKLEIITETANELKLTFDGQVFQFYRLGYIFEVMKNE